MGFPSPAQDYAQARLDPTELIVKHPAATFFIRAETDNMARAGIRAGDYLAVDRSLDPQDGSIVIATMYGDFHIKQLSVKAGKHLLVSADQRIKPVEIDDADCQLWGVVTYIIRAMHK